jgi:hypothetical protein
MKWAICPMNLWGKIDKIVFLSDFAFENKQGRVRKCTKKKPALIEAGSVA